MNYQACLDYMAQHCRRGMPGGLERTRRMAQLVGNPQQRLAIIHIAGTNGKGSTAAITEQLLRQGGYRVGLFTSPHLHRYEERIQLNRQCIDSDTFAQLMTRLLEQVVPQLLAEGMAHPGEFELLTVLSWMYFADRTDFVVQEVGLGGALDPTNGIEQPLISVVTPVSLDHCQLLGDTVAQIAREKAGIIRAGVPVVIAAQSPEAEAVLLAVAEAQGAPVIQISRRGLRPIETNLQGQYQQVNGNTALAVVENLRSRGLVQLTAQQIAQGLQQVSWPGRMELIALQEGRELLLDGAHNPHGIQELATYLSSHYDRQQVVLFLSILDDKEQLPMLQQLLPCASQVVLTKPHHDDRAQHWQHLAQSIEELAPGCPCSCYEDYRQGLREALTQLLPGQLLCITGSLYLLGDCRGYLQQQGIIAKDA